MVDAGGGRADPGDCPLCRLAVLLRISMILLSVSSCGLNWIGGGFPAGGWLVGGVWESINRFQCFTGSVLHYIQKTIQPYMKQYVLKVLIFGHLAYCYY